MVMWIVATHSNSPTTATHCREEATAGRQRKSKKPSNRDDVVFAWFSHTQPVRLSKDPTGRGQTQISPFELGIVSVDGGWNEKWTMDYWWQ
jgi:hypothetical protein